ncbi:hypothetical protein BGZ46_000793 [Entomortierella lignicola]|nr:hypothetical protein BGZ46_000793 [Entomortierella lignicola]
MSTKFDSVYFSAIDKIQVPGPQERSFAWANQQANMFYVTYISGISKDRKTSYYEFSSYKDLPAFLAAYSKVPDKDRCFNEQIREGRSCSEYYDIDWTLKPPAKDSKEIVQHEDRFFKAFLHQRNQYAPQYPVSEDQCRVLSSSSNSKVSLHIIIPTYTFDNNNKHMLKFMQDFKTAWSNQDQDNSSLPGSIDMGVYTKNRGIRCLGSCKRDDISRRFIRAPWHQPSVLALDAEFFITNIDPSSTRIDNFPAIGRYSQPRQNQVAAFTSEETTPIVPTGHIISLPRAVVIAVQDIFIQHKLANQYKMEEYRNGVIFKLKRVCAGECEICTRTHDSENAYLKLGAAGRVYLTCHRVGTSLEIGRLDFSQIIATITASAAKQPSEYLDADTTYSERYVLSIPPDLQNKSLLIISNTGTGKTMLLEELIASSDNCTIFVVVTCRRSLALALAERFEFTNYTSIKGPIKCNRIVVQAESLHRLDMRFYKENVVLVLDEFSSLCEQMLSTTTMGYNHDYNNQVLREFVRGASRVIALDADLSNDEVQLVKSLRNDVHVIHNTFKSQEGDRVEIYESEVLLKRKVLNLLQNHKRIWISSTHSALNTEALHKFLEENEFNGKCVTGDTSEEVKCNITKNINSCIVNLDYFIHTPTITVGIDCNVPDCIDYVVGFFSTHSKVNVEMCRQMMRRVRNVKSKTYLVHVDRAIKKLPITKQGVHDWITNQANIVSGNFRAISGLKFEARYGEGFKLVNEDFYTQLYTTVRLKRNLSENDFLGRFIQQMVSVGCSIEGIQGCIVKGDPIVRHQKVIQRELESNHYQQIANARELDAEELLELYNKSEKTSADRYALLKYSLSECYNVISTDIITAKWVETYDNKQERSIYKNICALNNLPGENLEDKLEVVRQREDARLKCSSTTRVPHLIEKSQYVKLQYAVDIMMACGFESIFSKNTVESSTLKCGIDRIWINILEEMDNICTTLDRKKPIHSDWKFKNQLMFLNNVLKDVLGVKMVGINNRRMLYKLQHYSKVVTLKEMSFGDKYL